MQGNRREEDGFGWWPAMELDVSSFEASGSATRMQVVWSQWLRSHTTCLNRRRQSGS